MITINLASGHVIKAQALNEDPYDFRVLVLSSDGERPQGIITMDELDSIIADQGGVK